MTSPGFAQLKREIEQLIAELQEADSSLESDLRASQARLQAKTARLLALLEDSESEAKRIAPVIGPVLADKIKNDRHTFANIFAPLIGPAIRNQIRDAKDDIVEAFYPIIGQTIGKAVSSAFRELSRNIDARLRRSFSFRERFKLLFQRGRGVSETESIIRDAMPFETLHVFLIHRETGLVLSQHSRQSLEEGEAGVISGLLTAIRQFAKDVFPEATGELEEIQHGELRILIHPGLYAYLAIVVEGIEPTIYRNLMDEVVSSLNIEFEEQLRSYSGDQETLPDFSPKMSDLLLESPNEEQPPQPKQMTRSQKWVLGLSFLGVILTLIVTAILCNFAQRLYPLAYPDPTATYTPTFTSTSTSTPTSTATPTSTSTPSPTLTPTEHLLTGLLTGDLNVRSDPGGDALIVGVVKAGEEVEILDQSGDWYHISWLDDQQTLITGWIWGTKVEIKP